MKTALTLLLAVCLAAGPALATEKKKSKEKPKKEVAASCKVPAVDRCPACSITCAPGETVTCSPGMTVSNMCQTQPSCKCGR